jgi:hypothetical protein
MSAWEEYLAAAQRLDSVRREAAAAEAEQAGVRRAAAEELSSVRRRIELQRGRFAELSGRYALPSPDLAPPAGAPEADAALPPGAGPPEVLAALRQARSILDGADAELTAMDNPGTRTAWGSQRPAAIRNLAVYGAFALLVLVLQTVLFVVASEESLPLLAPVCGLVLPLLAFALGWITVGLVYPPAARGGAVERTPLVGAMVCLVAPVVLTCAGFGVLAMLR